VCAPMPEVIKPYWFADSGIVKVIVNVSEDISYGRYEIKDQY